ncbi:hypothetical protein PMAYCL1PPCAC_08979, partial [Pristionchus mayeri]
STMSTYTLFASVMFLLCSYVSAQDTHTNRLVDAVEDLISAEIAPFLEDIQQPEDGPGVCYENRTVSYNTTETVIRIETKTSTHFCLDFAAGFKCTKEERHEIPTEIPTVKQRDEMIAVCCEKYRYEKGKCVAIPTVAPTSPPPPPSISPRLLVSGVPPTEVTTKKPNAGSTLPASALLALFPALALIIL